MSLTDNVVPDILEEEADVQESGNEPYNEKQPSYFPPELVDRCPKNSDIIIYHCYLIELKQNFAYDIPVHDIVLAMRSELEPDVGSMHFDLDVFDKGSLTVNFEYLRVIHLKPDQVLLCRRFQITVLRVLINHNSANLGKVLDGLCLEDNLEIDYLLLPAIDKHQRPSIIDWDSVNSVMFSCENHVKECPKGYAHSVHTKDGPVCTCMLQNSFVCTPHNPHVYCITGILELNENATLKLRDKTIITYKQLYEERHDIKLRFGQESFLNGRHIFHVPNYLQKCRKQKEKELRNSTVELPPELCSIIMSPISITTFYTFSFVPSIMHRLESLLIAVNLKKMHLDHCMQNDVIPTIKKNSLKIKDATVRTLEIIEDDCQILHCGLSLSLKVLEAITTKECQEIFHLESLETLGDSFLKYAASQQLFKTYQNQDEGFLTVEREKMISNVALRKFGCGRKLPGFIRIEPFNPKKWIIPGDKSGSYALNEELLFNTRKIYVRSSRKVKSKTVADVVEALIGAFLSTCGETAALIFMDWIGIKVDFHITPYERHFQVQAEKLLNVRHLQFLLNYPFNDPSLLVEALTHGSYAEIPRSYQRLEFLGDSVLDYLITLHFYNEYPGLSPGLLTDMRSASVNNECYARSAVKVGLHEHILRASQALDRNIVETVSNFEKLSSESTFGWESESTFPKVLPDVIESLAGAILVDSGYNKERVFQSMRPLLDPLITPETVVLQPAKELSDLCAKEHYIMKKPIKSINNGTSSFTIEVEADGILFKRTATATNKDMAKKVASKLVLDSLKEHMSKKRTLEVSLS